MPNINAELEQLKALEKEIAHKISPLLLDYIFLFSPDFNYQIDTKNINKSNSELLNKYIILSDKLLSTLNIPSQPKKHEIVEDFLNSIRDMYLLRYTDAKALFASYELVRIQTKFEAQIKNPIPDETLALKIPNGLSIDENGEINWQQTLDLENKEHNIARYISAYKHTFKMSKQMFIDLQAITTKAMAYPTFNTELKKLTEDVLIMAIYQLSVEVHKYIDDNYPLQEALTNVYEYHIQLAKQSNNALMVALPKIFSEAKIIIDKALSEIPDLNPDTKSVILDDYFELLIAYIKTYKLLPKDYYKVEIRDSSKFYLHELNKNYDHIIDLYLYLPQGGTSEVAIESFNVEFTNEAKMLIFKSVIGLVENPKLTMENYLNM